MNALPRKKIPADPPVGWKENTGPGSCPARPRTGLSGIFLLYFLFFVAPGIHLSEFLADSFELVRCLELSRSIEVLSADFVLHDTVSRKRSVLNLG